MIKKTINPGAASDNTLELTTDLIGCVNPVTFRKTASIVNLNELVFIDASGAEQTVAITTQTTAVGISTKLQETLIAGGYVVQPNDGGGFGILVTGTTGAWVVKFEGEVEVLEVSGVATTDY